MRRKRKPGFFREHSLTLIAVAVLSLWIVLYRAGDPKTHAGSFFGNAIADWSGVVVTVLATKYFYERDSAESKRPPRKRVSKIPGWVFDHSLTIVLVVTGVGWLVAYLRTDPESKWGQVVGNVLSEWVQLIGVVLLTKRFFEVGSAESKGK
ncbi:MAG: hypothetical protein ABI682_10790 [Acidobacteriota bacterium]